MKLFAQLAVAANDALVALVTEDVKKYDAVLANDDDNILFAPLGPKTPDEVIYDAVATVPDWATVKSKVVPSPLVKVRVDPTTDPVIKPLNGSEDVIAKDALVTDDVIKLSAQDAVAA